MKSFLTLLFPLIFTTVILPQQQAENLDNQFRLAQSYEQAGQPDKAESIYLELYKKQSWNITFFEALNRLNIKQKNYPASLKLLEERISAVPNDISCYGMLGSTYYLMDDRQKAYDTWEKGIETNPSSAVVYRVIANYAIENRAFDKAIEILKRGQQKSDDPFLFTYDLANIYSVNMNFKAAADEYCSMIEARPDQIAVVKSRMASYLSRPSAAMETLETVKKRAESNPAPALLDLLASVYRLTGDYETAFETTVRWDKSSGAKGNSIFTFAQQAYTDRQYAIAAEAYKYLTDNFPGFPFIPLSRIGYARALEASLDEKNSSKQNSWKPYAYPEKFSETEYLDIIRSYSKLIEAYPDNAVTIEAFFRNAEIYNRRLNDKVKADSLYEEVIKLSPLSSYGLNAGLARAKIAMFNDRTENAELLLKSVLANPRIDNQSKNEADYLNGKIFFWKGDFKKAADYFRETAKDLAGNFTNDALGISALLSSARSDSAGLYSYAQADYLSFRDKFTESAEILANLYENSQNLIIKAYSEFKFAEMLIAENKYEDAVKILEEISDSKEYQIFADKATFLLAMTYREGLKNYSKSRANFEKILDKFPESLYFDSVREYLNKIKTNN